MGSGAAGISTASGTSWAALALWQKRVWSASEAWPRKPLPQWGQKQRRQARCTRATCFLRLLRLRYSLLHTLHLKCTSWVWVRRCIDRLSSVWKLLPHSGHDLDCCSLPGSPWKQTRCARRLLSNLKKRPHGSQLKGHREQP
uniref:Uncharacterized protein n=1 Tax=Ixodes ricinus TaxID=34613 RepID=A0A6B0UTM5_IXORI